MITLSLHFGNRVYACQRAGPAAKAHGEAGGEGRPRMAKAPGRRARARPGNTPRIEDVALRAGTSIITVSRALRQPEKVRPATRARVLAAVEALGYIPNLAASSLVSRRSGII